MRRLSRAQLGELLPALVLLIAALITPVLALVLAPRAADVLAALGAAFTSWLAWALLLPVLAGLVLTLATKRLWAWPYVYLLGLLLALTSAGAYTPTVDQMYLYTSELVLVLTILVAEAIGLSVGRWLSRAAGMTYFLAAAVWQVVHAVRAPGSVLVVTWQRWSLGLGALLFAVHAVIQFVLWRRDWKAQLAEAEQAAQEGREAPLRPTAGAEHGPWVFKLPWLRDNPPPPTDQAPQDTSKPAGTAPDADSAASAGTTNPGEPNRDKADNLRLVDNPPPDTDADPPGADAEPPGTDAEGDR